MGCCGFPTSKARYYKAFNLVELNSTFYTYPKLALVEKWRTEAPKGFEFTVKAHQDISHNCKFELPPACVNAFNRMREICEALDSKILLIQTPASFRPIQENMLRARKFFNRVDRRELTVVWETRGPEWNEPQVRSELGKVLEELDVPHVTDPFKAMPVYTGKIAYFRLHGLGARMYYYQYSNEELRSLVDKIKLIERKGKIVYILFNNLTMFEDGQRLVEYINEGTFPSITGAVGLESICRLIERTRYPVPKSKLSKLFGWKLVDWRKGRQIPLDEFLKRIPARTYGSVYEVIEEIKKIKV